jgi:F-type H+-transporting ATPase subunit epsilon
MAATLRLEIVTPEAHTHSEDVEMVVIPGVEGELGILPMHVPLATILKPGELVISKGGRHTHYAVGSGYVEVTPTSVSVLTDMALEESAIDEAAVQEAIARAEERMRAHDITHEEVATVEASLQKSLAQLHVKRRTRR